MEARKLKLLVTVKAYPAPSTRYEETVCCAGIDKALGWVRLYPVPYRDLKGADQFKKYDVLEVVARKRDPAKDNRAESWVPELDTLKVVGHLGAQKNWSARMEWIRPTLLGGYADLLRRQEEDGVSLGAFRPANVTGAEAVPEPERWSVKQKNAIRQGNLFSAKEPLEFVPYRFRLSFEDEEGRPHRLSIIDWEFFQLWRKERDRFGEGEKAAEQVRKKIEQVSSAQNDLFLFAGNQGHPAKRRTFMILGCCYPRKERQMQLGL